MKIRVANLASTVNKNDLISLFQEFGEVDSVKIFRTPSSALAFVYMDSEDEALEAVSTLEGEKFMDSVLEVAFSNDKIVAKAAKAKAISLDLDADDDKLVSQIEESAYNGEGEEKEPEEEEEFTWDKAEDLGEEEEEERIPGTNN